MLGKGAKFCFEAENFAFRMIIENKTTQIYTFAPIDYED